MKKLNLQMLHLSSALPLLVGLLSAAAVNAQIIQTATSNPHTVTCVEKNVRQPSCVAGKIKVAKYDVLFYGFVTKGPHGVSPVETEFKIYNNMEVLLITRRLLPNQALNGNMRVTNDDRYYWATAKLLSEKMYVSSVAARLSLSPANLKAPTLQDRTAGGLF